MQKVFKQFAREEEAHKRKLLNVKEGKKLKEAEKKITDLKISDYLVERQPSPDMDYQDALILAMQKEKASCRLYNVLAESATNEDLQNIFLSLAQEEAKHKLRFEIEYDQEILKEN